MLIPPKNDSNGHADLAEVLARKPGPDFGYRIVDLPSERCWAPTGQLDPTPDAVEELHASLDKHGQMIPAIAGERDDMPENFWIFDGNGRLSWTRMRQKPLRAILLDHVPDEAEIITIRLTTATIKKSLDKAAVGADILRWQKLKCANQAEAAEHFGYKSQSAVCKLVAPFENGIEELIEALKERKITGSNAYLVATLSHEAQRQVLPEIIQKRLPRKRVQHIVDGFKSKKAKAEKSIKLAHGGVMATVTGNALESLKAFCAKAMEAVKKIERDNLPPDILPGMMG